MNNAEFARLFYRELEKIHELPVSTEGVQNLYHLLQKIVFHITHQEQIPFTTFFSRLAYAFQKYEVPSRKQFYIHQFRKHAQKFDSQQDTDIIFKLGIRAVADAISLFYRETPPLNIQSFIPSKDILKAFQPSEAGLRRPFMRVVVLSDDPEKEQFIATEEETGAQVNIQYNIAERNDNFRKSVAVLKHIFKYPTVLHLLDVEVSTEGVLRPKAFVIEPDYLVDVTAIAECFRKEGAEPLLYLLNKFIPFEVSPSIMKGHIANNFLDELVANADVSFDEIFPKVFKINPLAFCLFEEKIVREIFQAAKGHFIHLKRVLKEDFAKAGIAPEHCYLEPSFYAPKYGIQGRLDLFYQHPKTHKSAIVELKSGSNYRPNIYGISNNHFTQTLLYDLLIDAAFKGKLDPTNYILYSVLERDNLKFAPPLKTQQYEALNVRNQLLALERSMIDLNKKPFEENNIFKRLINNLLRTASGFEKRDIDLFDKTYSGLSDLEKKYFTAFAALISREHQLAKIGVEGMSEVNGVASLWLNNIAEKEENYEIFSGLKIIENKTHEADAFLILQKTEKTNPLANFRKGDIIVLYPASTEGVTVTDNQIFKCTLIDIAKETITLRLRSRQLNKHIFDKTTFWNVEHDLLDSSFVGMYRGLFEFLRQPKRKRELLLTQAPPSPPKRGEFGYSSLRDEDGKTPPLWGGGGGLTAEQTHILNKIIHSKDYFLLWGPPGTGKTSVMLKHLVGYYLNNTSENILLLAYTNRAVDEICEAIESLGDWVKGAYIRIGSRFSTSPQYQDQLLDKKIENITTRKDLKALIEKNRVFVATVASMTGKMELLQLKKFNRVLIDEASQILEPQLVGLLSQFEHFTLIGDHKQLPAVVQQAENESVTFEKELHTIGLHNLRNSFFERLYKRCITEGWTWAYDVLSHQGRMHHEIMQFPGIHFYENKLRILPEGINSFQIEDISFNFNKKTISDYEKILLKRRIVFLNTDTETNGKLNKTNVHEARLISQLVKTFHAFSENHTPLSIGVITPYRAQIAQIQSVLREEEFDIEKITIDTVERYQGGARDVILISLCTNEPSQLASLISLSEEGVDRKLNVALTRARKHLVIVGNAEILRGSEIYRRLIEAYGI